MRSIALLVLLLTAPAAAQELPALDSRIVSIPVSASGRIYLGTAPEVMQTILFQQSERIVSVILSDPSGFLVRVSGSGDNLVLKAIGPSAKSVMTVRTDARTYEFDLVTGELRLAPTVVRLTAPREYTLPQLRSPDGGAIHTSYRLSGSKALLPTSISDDGEKTYIEWAGDRSLPATFAIGPTGKEQMVDGYMRDGKFTIDRVYKTLIFRIDKEHAKAARVEDRKRDR